MQILLRQLSFLPPPISLTDAIVACTFQPLREADAALTYAVMPANS
jgi:hypothetical protein